MWNDGAGCLTWSPCQVTECRKHGRGVPKPGQVALCLAWPSSSPAQEVVPVGILVVHVHLQVLPGDFVHHKLERRTGCSICELPRRMKQTSSMTRGQGGGGGPKSSPAPCQLAALGGFLPSVPLQSPS